ncbi:MAG: hypothetical protein HW377_1769, partial [Actinobacteria bacterium]|nr:hypothetical protein [Actinomycetota bacterium]
MGLFVAAAAIEEHALHKVKRDRKGDNHAYDLQDEAHGP